MALIKLNERTIRKVCDVCKRTDVHYWARTPDSGRKVLIDKTPETERVPQYGYVAETSVSACFRGRVTATATTETTESSTPKPEAKPEPTESETPTVTTPTASAPTSEAAALDALRTLLSPTVSREDVAAIVKEELASIVFPVRTVVVRNNETKPVEGITHERFARVLRWLAIGSHVYLYGPASSGKSHMGQQTAEALGLPYQGLISISAGTMDTDLLGYIVPGTGSYQESGLYRAVANGGVYVIDEVDKGHPGIISVLNAITANGAVEFPCGMVKVHAEFRLIVTGNTYGTGPDALYVGSQQLDAATLTRFRRIEIPYDYALERSLCRATGLDTVRVDSVLCYVKALRENVTRHRLPLVFAPRQTVALCAGLADGMTWTDAFEDTMRAGITPTDWVKVSDGTTAPVEK